MFGLRVNLNKSELVLVDDLVGAIDVGLVLGCKLGNLICI